MLLTAARRSLIRARPPPSPLCARALHATAVARSDDEAAEGGGERRDRWGKTRRGRAFLDPRAPRHIDSIRSDPGHARNGLMMDVFEHMAYCDAQREEDEEGFFFDNTRPAYDSDMDADPFAANYLTEDEFEFPAEYQPAPYIPGRVMDAIWYAHSVKRTPVHRLVQLFGLPSARISAIISLKTVRGGGGGAPLLPCPTPPTHPAALPRPARAPLPLPLRPPPPTPP